jgi:hypothetical protein
MPIYTNKHLAEKYWKIRRISQYKEREQNYEGEDSDAIKNSVLVETPKHLIHWCNQYRLVPKANEDMRLVVDMREVNQFMVQKHFKMEGTPTLQDVSLKKAYNHVPVHPTFQNLLGI